MKFIVGKKLNMTQIFKDDGEAVPVTAIEILPTVVCQIKTKDVDGYDAVQLGFGSKKETKVLKPQKGHSKNLGNFEGFKEFKPSVDDKFNVGDKIEITSLNVGDKVIVSGTSKGKGFQGVVKRHGFAGGRRTHGQKHSEREPGAIGGGARAGGRVAKGIRMAGRMGSDRITINNLKVEAVIPETNLLLLRGAVPGKKGTLLEIKTK
jgi:large subunit ribosomal protein L3